MMTKFNLSNISEDRDFKIVKTSDNSLPKSDTTSTESGEDIIELETNRCKVCSDIKCICMDNLNTNEIKNVNCTVSYINKDSVLFVSQDDLIFSLPTALLPCNIKEGASLKITFQENDHTLNSIKNISKIQGNFINAYKCKYS